MGQSPWSLGELGSVGNGLFSSSYHASFAWFVRVGLEKSSFGSTPTFHGGILLVVGSECWDHGSFQWSEDQDHRTQSSQFRGSLMWCVVAVREFDVVVPGLLCLRTKAVIVSCRL